MCRDCESILELTSSKCDCSTILSSRQRCLSSNASLPLEARKIDSLDPENTGKVLEARLLEYSTKENIILRHNSFLSRNATVPIFGDEIKPSGRSQHFTCNTLEQGK